MSVAKKSPITSSAKVERQDQLDGVAVFVEVVRLGGFARAAEQLGLTRSAVGKAMARLEARLLTRLFHRSTRVQSLTEDGKVYYEHCLRAVAEMQAAHAQLELARREVVGRLNVSMPVLFGRHCIAPVLLTLAQEHPKLELHLSFSDRPVDILAEGFDLAIRMGALGAESEDLRARKLLELRKVVCASPTYLAAHGVPQTVAELAAHNILHYRRGERIHVWKMRDSAGKVGDVPLYSRLLLDDLEVIAKAAMAGMGLAWLPEWLVCDRIRSGELITVLEAPSNVTMECHALWPSASHMPLRVRLAIDALVDQLPMQIKKPELNMH